MSGMVDDHCRIGSLEILGSKEARNEGDHCRIGSLEKYSIKVNFLQARSLPHRQLRKTLDRAAETVQKITAA